MAGVVELRELATVVWSGKALELPKGLTTQVRPVDKKQNPLSAGVAKQAVTDIGGGEGLPRTRGHLNQGPGPVLPKRPLKILNSLSLSRPKCDQPDPS